MNMLNITLMLTVNLGILNLLPIPAPDGGRLVFLIWEAITHKPVPPEKRRHGTLYWTDVLHGTDGVPVI